MPNANCISGLELAEFVRGKLTEHRLHEVLSHVDACDTCQDTVVALSDASDTFVQGLRDVHQEDPVEKEGALRHGVQRLLASMRSRRHEARTTTASSLSRIGPYAIEEQLGSGGMGTVYRAQHSKLKRTVALKVLPAQRWANVAAVSRFEREMEAIGGLDHPHIVRASDAGEDEGMHYLVMEFVDGLDLSRLTRRLGKLPVAEACELARQTALGLQHAHENGLVHRDIKPSNLMLAWERMAGRSSHPTATLKILDLGLALLGDEHLHEGNELTTVGVLMGTLDYMSPEQGIDSHSVDHRADIYGLGATLFKLLTGRAPYADPKFSTLMKKMTALATKPAPSISEIRDDLPDDVVQVVDRMLDRDPDLRFPSASDVAEALAPAAKSADLRSLLKQGLEAEEPAEELTNVPGQLLAPSQNAKAEPAAQRRAYWPLWTALAAGFSLVAAGVVFFITTNYGEVVVRSDDPDAKLVIKQGDQEVERLQLERGAGTTTLRAGKYQVEIDGDVSELSVTPADFDVARLGTVEVRVQRKEETNAKVARDAADTVQTSEPSEFRIEDECEKDPRYYQLKQSIFQVQGELESMAGYANPSNPPMQRLAQQLESLTEQQHRLREQLLPRIRARLRGPNKAELSYEGKTIDEWLSIARSERSAKRSQEAIFALSNLTGTDRDQEIAAAILRSQRVVNPPAIDQDFLRGVSPRPLVAAILQEFQQGNRRSREFASLMLTPWFIEKYLSGHDAKELQETLSEHQQLFTSVFRELASAASNRALATRALGGLYSFVPNPTWSEPVQEILRAGLESSDDTTCLAAAAALVRMGSREQEIVDSLTRVLHFRPSRELVNNLADDDSLVAIRLAGEFHDARAIPLLHELAGIVRLTRQQSMLLAQSPFSTIAELRGVAFTALESMRNCGPVAAVQLSFLDEFVRTRLDEDLVRLAKSVISSIKASLPPGFSLEDEVMQDAEMSKLVDEAILLSTRIDEKRSATADAARGNGGGDVQRLNGELAELESQLTVLNEKLQSRRERLVAQIMSRVLPNPPPSSFVSNGSDAGAATTAPDESDSQWRFHQTKGPRYDGQTLRDWLAELEFERKPERLQEALAAISAMSRQLDDERLVHSIIDSVITLLRQHGVRYLATSNSSGPLTEKAWRVLIDMPLDQVARRMLTEFTAGNAQSRAALYYPLHPVFMSAIADPTRFHGRCRQLMQRLREMNALATLQELATRQPSERDWATEYLIDLARETSSPLGDLPGVDELLQSVVESPADDLAAKACHELVELASLSQRDNSIVAKIVDRAKGLLTSDSARAQEEAVFALEQVGSAAEPAVGSLMDLLESLVSSAGGGMGGGMMGGIGGGMGGMSGIFPTGSLTVMTATGTFKSYSADIRPAIIRTLGNIGPAAKEAIPLLITIYEEELEQLASGEVPSQGRMSEACLAAIEKIDPSATPQLYNDKTKNQWLKALASDSSVDEVLQALKAVDVLADANGVDQAEIVRGIFQLMRRYGTRYIDLKDKDGPGRVCSAAIPILLRMESPVLVVGIIEEVQEGNNASFRFVESLLDLALESRERIRGLSVLQEQPEEYINTLIRIADAPVNATSNWNVVRTRILLARLALWLDKVSPAHVSTLLRGYKDREGGNACVLALANILLRNDPTAVTLQSEQVPRQIFDQAMFYFVNRRTSLQPDLTHAIRQMLEGGFDLSTLGQRSRRPDLVKVLINNLAHVYRHTIKSRGATGGVQLTIAGSESAMDPVYIEASQQYSGWYPRDVRLDLIKALGLMGSYSREALPLLKKIKAEDLIDASQEAIEAIERPQVELRQAISKELPLAKIELNFSLRNLTLELSGWMWDHDKKQVVSDLAAKYFPDWKLIDNISIGHPQAFATVAKDGILFPVDGSGILLSPAGLSTEVVGRYPRIEIEGVELNPPAMGEPWDSRPVRDAISVLNAANRDWNPKQIVLHAVDYAPDVRKLDEFYKTPLTFVGGIGVVGPDQQPIGEPDLVNTFILRDRVGLVDYVWGHASEDKELNYGRRMRLRKVPEESKRGDKTVIDLRWMKWPE